MQITLLPIIIVIHEANPMSNDNNQQVIHKISSILSDVEQKGNHKMMIICNEHNNVLVLSSPISSALFSPPFFPWLKDLPPG